MFRSSMRFQVIALSLIIPAMASCGSSPKKEADKILGREKKEEHPFILDRSKLPGVYEASSISGQKDGGTFTFFGGDILRAHQQAWKITSTTVEIFLVRDDQKACGARPYNIEGNATLILAAANGCPAESLEFVAQEQGRLTFKSAPFTVGEGYTADTVTLHTVSTGELADSAFTWDTDFKAAPAWIRDILPEEAKEVAIAAARTGFIDAKIATAKMKIATDMSVAWGTESFGLKVAAFKNGKAMHWSKVSQEPGDTACFFIVPDDLADKYNSGIAMKVSNFELTHSRRQNGMLTIRNGEQTESDNPKRTNQMVLKFEGATQDVSLSCQMPSGSEVITIEKVKSALGTLVSFERE